MRSLRSRRAHLGRNHEPHPFRPRPVSRLHRRCDLGDIWGGAFDFPLRCFPLKSLGSPGMTGVIAQLVNPTKEVGSAGWRFFDLINLHPSSHLDCKECKAGTQLKNLVARSQINSTVRVDFFCLDSATTPFSFFSIFFPPKVSGKRTWLLMLSFVRCTRTMPTP